MIFSQFERKPSVRTFLLFASNRQHLSKIFEGKHQNYLAFDGVSSRMLNKEARIFSRAQSVPNTGFERVLENLESHGILFFSFPGLESHGILCRVMESHGKLNHYKKL